MCRKSWMNLQNWICDKKGERLRLSLIHISDDKVSLLGFGLMRLPKIDPEKSDIDKEKAQEMIDYAYSHGINYFDTAYPYHEGKSELFVGEAMKKYPRESFHLASKMPVWLVEKPEDTLKYFEEQLNKCQVEYFDYYLCHALNHDRLEIIKKNHIFETLQKMCIRDRYGHFAGADFASGPGFL